MDEMVLKAQKWVNETYGGNPQFEKVNETGKTGWSTMFALTKALQIELGITNLSNNFGPTTLAKLEEKYPEIGIHTNTNTNIIKIIQSGMYCKGYDGDWISGTYSLGTAAGIQRMTSNMGLGGSRNVTPKVFKALLTMDAYTIVGRGTETIRKVQQWLNAKYIHRKNFFIIPCDGNFSRDVQKALVYGIQYELGMNDATANGNFGPATREGIRKHPLSVGDKDGTTSFVHLFQAAMIFNNFNVDFNGQYTSALSNKVREFQRFALLSDHGGADFETWASLLVSTGDPTRKGKACDCVTEVTPARAQALKKAGYETVGRYLTNATNSSLNKKIQPGELENIFAAGLTVFPIYQTYGGEASYFHEQQGKEDAIAAYKAASQYGFNKGTIIYFAVDFDALDKDIKSNIIPYFRGVKTGIESYGGKYRIGVYGARNVCIQVSNENLAVRSFVSGMSTGFSGNLGFPLPKNWAFDQISTVDVGSGEGYIRVDNNIKSGRDLGSDNVKGESQLNTVFLDHLSWVYSLAEQYAAKHNSVSPNILAAQYYRSITYSGPEWNKVAGKLDETFIAYVNSQGRARENTIVDPITLIDLGADHLMAALNGVLHQGFPGVEDVNLGDGAGWMGDLVTIIVDYKKFGSNYDSAYDFAMDYIAATKVNGHYNLDDYIEDIDGWNIAYMLLTGQTKSIVDAFRTYYSSGYKRRYSSFFQNRYGGSLKTAISTTGRIFLNTDPYVLLFTTLLLLKNIVIVPLTPTEIADICLAYGKKLQMFSQTELILQ